MIGFAGGLVSRYRGIDLVTVTSGDVVDSFTAADDGSAREIPNTSDGVAQSWTSGADPQEVTGVVFRFARDERPIGLVRAHIYAHSGTFGTSSVPTGAPLVSSAFFAIDVAASTSRTDYFFSLSGWTPDPSTRYVAALENADLFGDSANNLDITIDTGAQATHDGNISSDAAGGTVSWSASSTEDLAFAVYETSASAANQGHHFRGNVFNRRRFGGMWALLLMCLAGCDSIFGITVHSRVADDPCFAATVWVDTLTLEVDSVTIGEWTPGKCD